MSAANFPACLAFTLKQEGGYTYDPQDPGGPTNYGITLAELRLFTHQLNLGIADIKGISQAQVQEIYQKSYWEPVRGDELPPGLDLMVFDMGVNAGPSQSIKLLQRTLGVTDDGVLGPVSMAAAQTKGATVLADLYAKQQRFYQSLSGFQHFGAGWIARCSARYVVSLALAKPAVTAT